MAGWSISARSGAVPLSIRAESAPLSEQLQDDADAGAALEVRHRGAEGFRVEGARRR